MYGSSARSLELWSSCRGRRRRSRCSICAYQSHGRQSRPPSAPSWCATPRWCHGLHRSDSGCPRNARRLCALVPAVHACCNRRFVPCRVATTVSSSTACLVCRTHTMWCPPTPRRTLAHGTARHSRHSRPSRCCPPWGRH